MAPYLPLSRTLKVSVLAVLSATISTMASADLTAWYKLDDTTASVAANGVLNSAIDPVTPGDEYDATNDGVTFEVPGIVGTGIESGKTVMVEGPNNSTFGVNGNNARTLSFWFNANSQSQESTMVGMGGGSRAQFNITFENLGGSGNSVNLRYGNGNVGYNNGSALSLAEWYHVAVVYDGTTLVFNDTGTDTGNGLYFYINGAMATRVAGNLSNEGQTLITNGFFSIGNVNSQNNGFDGFLDEVQVYDEVLSASDIAYLYNNPGSAIPEPSTYAALFGLATLGFVAYRRSRK